MGMCCGAAYGMSMFGIGCGCGCGSCWALTGGTGSSGVPGVQVVVVVVVVVCAAAKAAAAAAAAAAAVGSIMPALRVLLASLAAKSGAMSCQPLANWRTTAQSRVAELRCRAANRDRDCGGEPSDGRAKRQAKRWFSGRAECCGVRRSRTF